MITVEKFLSPMLMNSLQRRKGPCTSRVHTDPRSRLRRRQRPQLLLRCLPQVVAMLQKFYSSSESALGLSFISELVVRFRHCSKWVGRQAFAFICQVSEAWCGGHGGPPRGTCVRMLMPSALDEESTLKYWPGTQGSVDQSPLSYRGLRLTRSDRATCPGVGRLYTGHSPWTATERPLCAGHAWALGAEGTPPALPGTFHV